MIAGIPVMLGLGTRMSDPHVYVVLWVLLEALLKPAPSDFRVIRLLRTVHLHLKSFSGDVFFVPSVASRMPVLARSA